jgi:pyrroloquinoline quinone biosynthesis protein B
MSVREGFAGGDVFAVLLGSMQDAGLPHAGCQCAHCRAAFADPTRIRYATALAIIDNRPESPAVWLIDATPDIKYQLHALAGYLGPHPTRPGRLRQPDGLFLTHGHMGHTAGLAHLGPEVMAVGELPVYGPAGLLQVLSATALWRPAVQGFAFRPLESLQSFLLAPDLTITPRLVPHRDEWHAGTFAYEIAGPHQRLLYLPDIDSWAAWPEAVAVLAGVNVALVDASFWSDAELGGRPPVAHPLVPDTLELVAEVDTQIVLTHLNHTNPLLNPAGPESQLIAQTRNVRVGRFGQQWAL